MGTDLDTLTGLQTHAALERHLGFSIEAEESAALALVDIDGFARVNAELGPGVGDRVLVELAHLLDEAVAGAAYRVSADEFAALLPSTTLEQAFLRMEAVRTRVGQEQERFALPEGWRVAVSAGVAQHPRDGKTAAEVSNAAAAALRAAKEAGGDQVALPPNEPMVMKSAYYPAPLLAELKALAERRKVKESELLREALNDLLRKYTAGRGGPGGPGGWQSFTAVAKRVVFFGQEETRARGSTHVTPEHLLLGLTGEGSRGLYGHNVAVRLLQRLGVDRAAIRAELERDMPRIKPPARGPEITLAPRARRLLDLANDEARRLNDKHIGTEHLLLGIIREGGPAARLLVGKGAELDAVRQNITDYLASGGDYTPRLSSAAHQAQREAVERGSGALEPEHLLLVLARDEESAAAQLLARLGAPPSRAVAAMEEAVPPTGLPSHFPEQTARWNRVMDLAHEAAEQSGRKPLGTEHLLLGTVEEGGPAARALAEMGVDAVKVREAVGQLGDEREPEPPPSPPRPPDPVEEALRARAKELGVGYCGPGAGVRIREDAVRRLPLDVAERLGAVPMEAPGARLYVAMKDPTNKAAIQEIARITGMEIHPGLAPPEYIQRIIAHFRERPAPPASTPEPPTDGKP